MPKPALKPELMNCFATPLELLRERHGCQPVLACELEWMVLAESGAALGDAERQAYLDALAPALAHLPLHSLDKEDGKGQVEAALLPQTDIALLCEQERALRLIATETAATMGFAACFLAKPFADDFGNGLHIHIHLQNGAGENLFWKKGEELSPHLAFSIAGLLAHIEQDLPVFAGSEAAYARYVPHCNAPVNASWGTNNRSVALRLPDGLSAAGTGQEALLASTPSPSRRIEHRLASSEARLDGVIAAILYAIEDGLTRQQHPPKPIYGNAADAQYGLPLLFHI